MSGDRKVSVKIVIERDANPTRIPGGLQDLGVPEPQPNRSHSRGCIEAAFCEQDRGARCQSLVEQNLDHAMRSIPRLSSSTIAAA